MIYLSAIFELGYEFENQLEKDLFIIERTAEIQMNQLMMEFDALAMMEKAGKETQPETSGLIGLVKRAFHTISEMLKSFIAKIKSLITGEPVDKDVKYKKDPRELAKACDAIISEDLSLLDALKSGKINLDYIQGKTEKHKGLIDSVAPYAGPIAALEVGILADKLVLTSWKSKIDQAYSQQRDVMSDYAEQLARSKRLDSKRDTIKEATQLLLKDIYAANSAGSNAVTRFFVDRYARKEVGKRLTDEAKTLDSKTGGIKHRVDTFLDRKKEEQEAKRLQNRDATIKSNREKNKAAHNKLADAKQSRADAEANFYNDVGKKKFKTNLHDKVRRSGERALEIDARDMHSDRQQKDGSLAGRVQKLNNKTRKL